jgi:hypothetical protein
MSYLFIKNLFQREKFVIFSRKNKNKNKTQKPSFDGFFWVFWVGFFGWVFLLPTLVQGGAGGMSRPALPVRGTPPGMPPPPGYHHSTAANSSSPQLSATNRLLSRSRAQSNLSVNTSIEVGVLLFFIACRGACVHMCVHLKGNEELLMKGLFR